jgi:N,N'-diacetyllegionaminate synthase
LLKNKTFVIAEAGVNHNGDMEIARRLIDEAASAGADAVKFQTFKPEALAAHHAAKAEYQMKNSGKEESQLSMLKKYELSEDDHHFIFLSSAFDLRSIDLLKRLGQKIWKIPSGEITNLPYLQKIGNLNGQLIISTGMANLKEVEGCLEILINSGTARENITLLHCNTQYPTPFEDVNLLAMLTLKNSFLVKVGYSDHTLGFEASLAAVALGACVIEKHFTLDKTLPGPDHRASLEPGEIRSMIRAIRNIEYCMGDGVKRPSKSEAKNLLLVRKSILASKRIMKGERFTEGNITVKRPGTGLSPMLWNEVLGRSAKRDFEEDDFIET